LNDSIGNRTRDPTACSAVPQRYMIVLPGSVGGVHEVKKPSMYLLFFCQILLWPSTSDYTFLGS